MCIELEDDDDLEYWHYCLSIIWTVTGDEFDIDVCPYTLSEIEWEFCRRNNLEGDLE